MKKDEDIARIDAALQTLGEFFDTVQIFATRVKEITDSGGGTVHCNKGTGNWFARYGHVRMWCLKHEGSEWREPLVDEPQS